MSNCSSESTAAGSAPICTTTASGVTRAVATSEAVNATTRRHGRPASSQASSTSRTTIGTWVASSGSAGVSGRRARCSMRATPASSPTAPDAIRLPRTIETNAATTAPASTNSTARTSGPSVTSWAPNRSIGARSGGSMPPATNSVCHRAQTRGCHRSERVSSRAASWQSSSARACASSRSHARSASASTITPLASSAARASSSAMPHTTARCTTP